MADPHARLIRALIARSDNAAVLLSGQSAPWASVTFTGARHVLALAMPAAIVEAFAQGLEAHEFAIPGHIVADIAVAGRDMADGAATLAIEALTIEEG